MGKILKILAFIVIVFMVFGGAVGIFINKKVGECRKGTGEEAIIACTMLINYSPSDMLKAFFLRDRSMHYEKLGDRQAMLEDLKTLVSFDEKGSFKMGAPLLIKVYGAMALVNGELGNEREAVKYAQEAIKLGSTDATLYLSLGGLNVREGKFNDAVAYLQKAESLGARDSNLYFFYGLAYLGLLDFQKSYDYMKRAEPLINSDVMAGRKPQEEMGRFDKSMGFLCAQMKNYPEAEQYLLKAISSGYPCPECEPALAQLREAVKAMPGAGKKAKKKIQPYN